MTTFDLNFAADHFSLFHLPLTQGLDVRELDARFREIQAKVHPDRHASAGEADRRLSMQWATRINEAYQTLKSPLTRARYLLQLHGHDPKVESNTAMPAGFLMAQMELREAVEEARSVGDDAALDSARSKVLADMQAEHGRLRTLIDAEKDYPMAATLVRQLMFQEKLLHEIDNALESVLG